MPVTRNGLVLANLMRGTSQIAFVKRGTAQIWANEIVIVMGNASSVVLKTVVEAAKPGAWADRHLKKRVVVPAGVEIGATNGSYAIAATLSADGQAGSWAGSLTLEVRGTVSGIGGAANSGKGGDVIWVNFPGRNGEKLQINVLPGGLVRAGGGGGMSGAGGQGFYQTPYTYQEGPIYQPSWYGAQYAYVTMGTTAWWYWAGTMVGAASTSTPYVYYGDGFYYAVSGNPRDTTTQGNNDNGYDTYYYSAIYRWQTRYNNYYPLGGAARPGGRGAGFDGPAQAGGAAVGGAGSGAGASGTGGTGGGYGNSGGAGTAGVTGNYGGPTGGAAGGLSGFYLNGAANSNIANAGSLLGRVA